MLKTKKTAIYAPANRINVSIVYELGTWSRDLNSDFTLKDCFFGGVKLAKMLIQINAYILVMVLDSIHEFSLPDGSMSKNVIIFGIHMSLSKHIDNKKKDI